MEGERTFMKNKKLLAKLIFVAILLLIIWYTFKDSAEDIVEQLGKTSLTVLVAIMAATVIYHLFEAWITYSLGKKGVGYSEATGLYMIQYMVHKVSVALFSGLLFVLNWKVMSCNYREYGVYLGLAYLLTAIISIALIIFAVSAKSHKLILAIVRHFNKSGRLTPALTKLEQSCDIMEKSTSKLLKDVPSLISMVLKNMAKLCFWYCVPFLILFGSNEISLLDSLSITSLSVMTAAVIPTPAGIGAVELIMTNLFAVLVGVHKAGAITVLYRVATFIFPFVVGGVLILISKVVHRHK